MKIKRALVSVSDKGGLVPLCDTLNRAGVILISTGGTAKVLQDSGIPVSLIDEVTGFPEMMDGRVKTLHPKVHGGLLGLRENSDHVQSAQEAGIEWIDLVVVNLYPFENTVKKEGVTLSEAIENIDIGGPSMLRSAAKNHQYVTVLSDPSDYDDFISEFEEKDGEVSEEFRARMAAKVFSLTSRYDGAISNFLQSYQSEKTAMPDSLHFTYYKSQSLRYGENPHQKAALYVPEKESKTGVAQAQLLNGKPLSFNNLIDANGAWNLVQEFAKPACAVIKHTNPCGCALGESGSEAFLKAWEGDPVSAFGSIIAFNRPVDAQVAQTVVTGKRFIEVICAPDFSSEAVEILSTRKGWGENLRILSVPALAENTWQLTAIDGGVLVQESDVDLMAECVNQTRDLKPGELEDLTFAFSVVKHVKSNAITIAKEGQLLGVGAGQMNRVQSVELALKQAEGKLEGAVLASDAFFPFRDSIDRLAGTGIRAVIQPGGSKKDSEVIAACQEHDMALVFTGMRHFRHG